MELTEEQETTLGIIKEWLIDQNAVFLAMEDRIVFWASVGNIRKQGWQKLNMKEAVNIIRATKVPIGLMHLCKADLVRAAAQEEDRTYIAGCDVVGEVEEGYFNYNKNNRIGRVCELPEHRIAVRLLVEMEQLQENIVWSDLAYIYEQAVKYCELPAPTRVQRNIYLRYGMNNTEYIERRSTPSFNGRYLIKEATGLKAYTCIKLPHRSGVKKNWSKDDMRSIILRAVKTIKK